MRTGQFRDLKLRYRGERRSELALACGTPLARSREKFAALFVFLLFLLVTALPVRGQSIFTYAGGGTGDYSPATTAAVTPLDVAIDASGSLLIADGGLNNRVRLVDKQTGIITTVAGNSSPEFSGDGGPAMAAGMNPKSIAMGPANSLFIADGNRVRRVDGQTRIITTVAGNGTSGFSGDGGPATAAGMNPAGISVDPAGNIFIVDGLRVRRVDGQTNIITTYAGNGTKDYTGDGGPASAAGLDPRDICVDTDGNPFIADGARVRRVDARTNLITTFAGSGGPATTSEINPLTVTVDRGGNMFVSERQPDGCSPGYGPVNHVLRIDGRTGAITAVAGNDSSVSSGDGGPATSAGVAPWSVAVDQSGNVFIADGDNYRVRRVDALTNIITTVAGNGSAYYSGGDGGPAIAAGFDPGNLATGPDGTVFVVDGQTVRRIDSQTRVITTFVDNRSEGYVRFGGLATDSSGNLLATEVGSSGGCALFIWVRLRRYDTRTGAPTDIPLRSSLFSIDGAQGIAADRSGNVFFAASIDFYYPGPSGIRSAVLKVNVTTGEVTVFAGGGDATPSDGQPATAVNIDPMGLVLDRDGNLFLADWRHNRVHRVDGQTRIITTVAGTGQRGFSGDEGPATAAKLNGPLRVALDAGGSLLIVDGYNGRVRSVDGQTGIITTVVGKGSRTYSGDGGPATRAGIGPMDVAVDKDGNVFVSDGGNRRVRVVYACKSFSAPSLISPQHSAVDVVSPVLSWTPVPGSFKYDLFLDTSAATTKVAADLTATSFVPANLTAGTHYKWRVDAKGDPFCASPSISSSETLNFTTAGGCFAPARPELKEPVNGAADLAASPTLKWAPVPGASSYDLYLGTTSPPPLLVQGLTATSYSPAALQTGARYSWTVVARAFCDLSKTTSSGTWTFQMAGTCLPPGSFTLTSPPAGASDLPAGTILTWTASPNAGGYAIYFGTESDPPLYSPDLPPVTRTLSVNSLKPATTYNWKVIAKPACPGGVPVETPVRSFRTSGSCVAPKSPELTFVPKEATKGQTYVIAWKAAEGLDAGGAYRVERSKSPLFSPLLDRQIAADTFASFAASETGRIYHRVFAVAGCDANQISLDSDPKTTMIAEAGANVVFTVQPKPVFATLGEDFENINTSNKTSFTLQNLGGEPFVWRQLNLRVGDN